MTLMTFSSGYTQRDQDRTYLNVTVHTLHNCQVCIPGYHHL